MGKAFSETEREVVKEKLLAAGEELFTHFGLKKTSVGDITKKTGIGRGTFYLFYASKEEFFIEIIEHISARVKAEILSDIATSRKHPSAAFTRYLNKVFRLAEENPLLGAFFTNKEDFDLLVRSLSPERINTFLEKNNQIMHDTLRKFKDAGIKVNVQFDIFSGLVRGLNVLSLYQDVIGRNVYSEVFDFMTEAIAASITGKSREKY